jgi:hypothetical protein
MNDQLLKSRKLPLAHLFAGGAVMGSTMIVSALCYVAGVATAPHAAGSVLDPMPSFTRWMLVGFALAVFGSFSAFIVSLVMTWVRKRWAFPRLVPIVVVPLLAFIAMLLFFGQVEHTIMIVLTTVATFAWFGIYWTVLTFSCASGRRV